MDAFPRATLSTIALLLCLMALAACSSSTPTPTEQASTATATNTPTPEPTPTPTPVDMQAVVSVQFQEALLGALRTGLSCLVEQEQTVDGITVHFPVLYLDEDMAVLALWYEGLPNPNSYGSPQIGREGAATLRVNGGEPVIPHSVSIRYDPLVHTLAFEHRQSIDPKGSDIDLTLDLAFEFSEGDLTSGPFQFNLTVPDALPCGA